MFCDSTLDCSPRRTRTRALDSHTSGLRASMKTTNRIESTKMDRMIRLRRNTTSKKSRRLVSCRV